MKREDLFSLIHPRADWHLDNWRKWMKTYQVGQGYPHASAFLQSGGISGEDEFEVMCQSADRHAAKVSDSIIDSLKLLDHRYPLAIFNVYLARVWTYRGDPGEIFAKAVEEFWSRAQRKGLV